MDTVTKAIFLGTLTNRSVCMNHFNSDYRERPDISPQHFIDINATNNNLAELLRSPNPTAVMVTTDVAKAKCVCLLLQGDGAPAGVRRCQFGDRGTTRMVRDLDANYTNMLDFLQRPDIRNIPSLCMSPGMPYFEPIRPEHKAQFRKIQACLVHPTVFTSIANFVKAKEGLCAGRCTGSESYISTHPRLENDFISQLQMISGFYQKRGINAAFNNAIVDSFLRGFQEFSDSFSMEVDTIHISTGLGKGEDNVNNFLIENYYEKKFKAVSSYHYEYLTQVMQVAHHANHSSHFGNETASVLPDPHNVTHHVSHSELVTFHHVISGIDKKKSRLRDLHAAVDFLIAGGSSFFYGVCASSFTGALSNVVDISGCFEQNVTYLQSLTQADFEVLTVKIDTLRKDPGSFFSKYMSAGKYMR